MPVDVVSVRPKDKIIDVMVQIAECYDGGHFFSDGDGNLVFGIFDSTDVDVDLRDGQIIEMDSAKMVDKVISIERAVGANCYGEVRDSAWGRALSGHRYAQEENSVVFTGAEATARAQALMRSTQKVSEFRPQIKGHPGLQVCDMVVVADADDLPAQNCRVINIDERLGAVYEQSLGQLVKTEPESP
jgi:prophage tail gpP-like protein